MPQRSVVALTTCAIMLAGCSNDPAGGSRTPDPLPTSNAPTSGRPGETGKPGRFVPGAPRDLVTGLRVPWAIAFLPSGDALVTERDTTRLLRVTPEGEATEIAEIPGVRPDGEGGLMGVAVSPAYAQDRQIFLYFTAADDNRVVRYRYDGKLGTGTAILTGIPKGSNHNGGRIAFGPGKHLYVATGEVYQRDLAQDKNSLGGKILRITPDGKAAPGNPFNSRIWTYGHRNVQGLTWDDNGKMYATEFGQDRFDEVNRITKGGNYGWPEVEGVGGQDRYTDPLLTWTTDESSPSGLAFAGDSLWAAALRGRRLWQIPVAADGSAGRPIAHHTGRYGRLRAVVRAPDGSLWVTTSNHDGRGDPRQGDDRIIVIPLGGP